jgi:hypothetical protein
VSTTSEGYQNDSVEASVSEGVFRLTGFPDKYAGRLIELEYSSLDELASEFQSTDASSKDELPWIKLAKVSGEPSEHGSLRYDDAIVELWGSECDYDGGAVSIEEAADKLSAAGIAALLYETASSTPEQPRWRVLCWSSQGYAGGTEELRELRTRWVARINGVLGGILAPESFTLSQAYYVGGIQGKPVIKVLTTTGAQIDLRGDLDAGAIGKNGRDSSTKKTERAERAERNSSPSDPDPRESDDDTRLLQECTRRVEGFRRRWGVGSTPAGERAHKLVQWLGDIGTLDGLTPSGRMIERLIKQDYPETDFAIIADMLARRRTARGWDVIDACDAEPEPEPARTPISVAEAKQKLGDELDKFLRNPFPIKRLIKAAMGLGKTDMTLHRIAADLLMQQVAGWDDGPVVYAAQRHALLRDAAEKLRGYLAANGWSKEAIDENVVILQSRHHEGRDKDGNKLPPLCLRHAEAVKVVEHGGSPSESLCRRPATKTRPELRCPFFDECLWQKMRRQAGRARFVFMTHSHLTSHWPPAGRPGIFHPKNAKLLIIDEDPIPTLFDQEPTRITAGAFKELVPELGEKIEKILAGPRPDALDFLRASSVTPEQLYIAAEARKKREKRRRIGHPEMSDAERAELVEQIKKAPPPPARLSHWLTCLADEVASGRKGECLSLCRESETGDILARARKPLWDTSGQKWLVLDGTANVEDLRCVLPGIQEVLIEVPRNAVFIQVSTNTYSKNTTLRNGKPTQLLNEACDFIEIIAQTFPNQVAVFTTKEIRRALTGEGKNEKLDVHVPLRGARLGHYRNVRGSNEFEDCQVGFLIGRAEDPVAVNENDTRAFHYDSATQLQFVEPDVKGAKRLPNRTGWYTMRDGRRVEARLTRHPDPRSQRRVEASREAEMLQAIDRLRLVHNREPKLVFIFSSVPLPIPVDVLISEDDISKVVVFRDMLAEPESAGFGSAAPMTGVFLSRICPERWSSPKDARNWLSDIFTKQDQWVPEGLISSAEPNKDILLSAGRSHETFKTLMIRQVLAQAGWELARFKQAGTKSAEWSLFIHRPAGSGVREALAAALETAPANLSLTTLAGKPLGVDGEVGGSGDALLDQALTFCVGANMALPLDPEPLAALPGSPWTTLKAVKNWAGRTGARVLREGPPPGWFRVEYRLARRRGGRASVAWVPEAEATEPRGAIARALGVGEDEIVLRPADAPAPAAADPPVALSPHQPEPQTDPISVRKRPVPPRRPRTIGDLMRFEHRPVAQPPPSRFLPSHPKIEMPQLAQAAR